MKGEALEYYVVLNEKVRNDYVTVVDAMSQAFQRIDPAAMVK